jgi:hypothetical protein
MPSKAVRAIFSSERVELERWQPRCKPDFLALTIYVGNHLIEAHDLFPDV